MKLTIDIPAPTQQLELISRLRQKIRNYKLTIKQLQRAHYITKDLLRRAEERANTTVLSVQYQMLEEAYTRLEGEHDQAKATIRRLREQNDRLLGELPMPVTFVPNGNGASSGQHYGTEDVSGLPVNGRS